MHWIMDASPVPEPGFGLLRRILGYIPYLGSRLLPYVSVIENKALRSCSAADENCVPKPRSNKKPVISARKRKHLEIKFTEVNSTAAGPAKRVAMARKGAQADSSRKPAYRTARLRSRSTDYQLRSRSNRKSNKTATRSRSSSPLRYLSLEKIERDEHRHLKCGTGDVIKQQFRIVKELGEGTFGKVYAVYNLKAVDSPPVALKVIRSEKKYRDAAWCEIRILKELAKKDPYGRHLLVKMVNNFEYHGHVCIAFEMLGKSVYEFAKKNRHVPYPMDQVRLISYQLIYAVKFLHDNGIIHTDLKPENMLFVNNSVTERIVRRGKERIKVSVMKNASIRLIDFGSAVSEDEHHGEVVTTRHYRAPEVILELGWSYPCDVWSIGCIIFELYSGITMFQTHDNIEHLAMMLRILDRPEFPVRMVNKTNTEYFNGQDLDWDENGESGKYVEKNCKPLRDHMKNDYDDTLDLFDLLEQLLKLDSARRKKLVEVLEHRYFEKLAPEEKLHIIHRPKTVGEDGTLRKRLKVAR